MIIKTLLNLNRRNKQKFLMIFIIYALGMIIVAAADVLMTRTTGDMSQAAVNLDTTTLLRFLGFLSVLMGIKAVFSSACALLLGRFTGNVEYRFRDNFTRHFLRLPFSDFERKTSGAMLSIYSNDLPAAAKYTTADSLGMVSDIITVLASIIYMLIINPLYTGIFYAMFPVLIIMQSLISAPIEKSRIVMSDRMEDFNSIVNDSLQNISTVAAYCLEDIMEKRYLTAYNEFFIALKRYILMLLRLVMAGQLASILPMIIIIAVCGYSVINGTMTLAEFIVFQTLGITASSWLLMLSQRLTWLKTSAAGAVKLLKHTGAELEDLHIGSDFQSTRHPVAVKFDNVSFSYKPVEEESEQQEQVQALDDVSFEILSGYKTAIVGGSGSGKSTILKILLGLYETEAGTVSVFDHDIKSLSKSALRDIFSYVPQDNFLFPVSIGENITGSGKTGTEENEKLRVVASRAGIMEFVETLPEKFNSTLSEAAENVSGGQRQRIAIARAFYKDSPIILFDEATSALDPVTESSIISTLETLIENRTLIMVSHRLRTIQSFDRIIVMDKGSIAGIGTHEELMKNNVTYSTLYNAQNANLKE